MTVDTVVQNALLEKAAGQLMGRSVSSHSRFRAECTQSARGTGLMATEMAMPGVAREKMPQMTGVTAEKDAPFQVRK